VFGSSVFVGVLLPDRRKVGNQESACETQARLPYYLNTMQTYTRFVSALFHDADVLSGGRVPYLLEASILMLWLCYAPTPKVLTNS
jgi:hypothetical protein